VRIDVHAHVWTEAYLDLLDSYGKTDTSTQRGMGAGLEPDELESRFELMDSVGVDRQVMSAAPQSPHFENLDHAVSAARFVNDEYAETTRRWPERFMAFASLPLPHADAALTELARAMDELGMLGVSVTTSVLGRSLADPAFEPVFEELDRRGAVLYVHPVGCGAGSALISEHRMTWMVGAPVEDTVSVMQLILAGIPSRYPNMKIINSHLGGALPMILQRADNQYHWEAPDIPEAPSVAARRMWYDTVGHAHPPALRAAVDTMGADRLILGTDFPYQAGDFYKRAVTYIERSVLESGHSHEILEGNAMGVFGL
jgi:aminocarboxymuconate-semialdehyde decarboxylase